MWRPSSSTLPGRKRRALALSPRAPGNHSQLEDASRSESENEDGTEIEREQKRNREREVPVETQECHFRALLVLQDEDQNHHQRNEADN